LGGFGEGRPVPQQVEPDQAVRQAGWLLVQVSKAVAKEAERMPGL
jgi:hypothetical protein